MREREREKERERERLHLHLNTHALLHRSILRQLLLQNFFLLFQ
jgi:hypothetical protein